LGYTPRIYTDAEVASGVLVSEGRTVLVISRKITFNPITQAYIDGVKNFVAAGGSLIGEYDGAALFFTQFSGSNSLIVNLTPSLQLFTGDVTGGGALLPIANSTTTIVDTSDPIMAGVPATFLNGVRAAFAITGFNSQWLHTSATFTSVGTLGLVPAGTFPAVMSGRCGEGRVVLFPLNYFQSLSVAPVNGMVNNAIRWSVGL